MIPESWVVLGMFVMYIIYYIVMSFTSKHYIALQNEGLGRWVNFTWMLIIVMLLALLLSISTSCVVKGNCRYMSITIATVVVGLTLMNMGWGIYYTVKKNEDSQE